MTRVELSLVLRRGEALLVTIAIPVGILVFFATMDVLPDVSGEAVDLLVPGVLALAVISTGMVALGISTGFERQQGVLKRLGATPLGRGGLLMSKLAAVACVIAVQSLLLAGTGWLLGWRPAGSGVLALGLVALGSVAFCGIGFALAGSLRAETNLAVSNALFLVMLVVGGVIVPVDRLPALLRTSARLLPAEPLTTGLRSALGAGTVGLRPLATLAAWAFAGCLLAVVTFRWEP